MTRKRKYGLLVICLLAGLTMGWVLPSLAGSNGLVTTDHTPAIIIDGDPSDWTGTAGPANNWTISNGEGIWNDAAFDDTGNGSYIYPNGTHTGPFINDSNGWNDAAYAYTGYPHGGMVDLREFRVTGDADNLYMMFRIENMGNQEIVNEYNAPTGTHLPGDSRFPYVNATGFGKILIQVYVSKDPGATSGRVNATSYGNFNLSSPWDFVIDVAGDVTWSSAYPMGYPRVEFANGTVVYLNQTVASTDLYQPYKAIYVQANCNIYPAAIEMKVPKSIIGEFDEQTWRFWVVVGGLDEGRWRQVWITSWAQTMGWPLNFRFVGGEGDDPGGVFGMGNDSNIIDMAFTPNQTAQEALLNEFQTTDFTVIDAYLDIIFENNVVIIPWTPILAIPIVLIALVIAKKRQKLPKTEHQ